MKKLLLMNLFAASVFLPAVALAGAAQIAKVEDALQVMQEIVAVPEKNISDRLLRNAVGIAVIPHVVKAGFVVGGRRGHGLLSVRGDDSTWSNPTFITLTGGSIGFQAGIQSTDIVLVFKSRRSIEGIVNGTFTLGADASVAAGPVGREAEAATDSDLRAEIYSYSRSRGLFAGVSLEGSSLKIDHASNESVFGSNTTPRQIFAGTIDTVPATIVDFRDLLEEQTSN
jgi:lipid-binding SYLF domain-containing protein